MKILEQIHWIGGIVAAADVFAGDPATDVFEVQGEGAVFLVWIGTNGGSGANAMTVEACDTIVPGNTTAVAFWYKASTTLDTWGDWTAATATGFTISGSNSMWLVYVPASELATEGYAYVRAQFTESQSDAIPGVVLAGIVDPRFAEVPSSQID